MWDSSISFLSFPLFYSPSFFKALLSLIFWLSGSEWFKDRERIHHTLARFNGPWKFGHWNLLLAGLTKINLCKKVISWSAGKHILIILNNVYETIFNYELGDLTFLWWQNSSDSNHKSYFQTHFWILLKLLGKIKA